MDRPDVLHPYMGLMISDPLDVLIGEVWVNAILCEREDGTQFWATPTLAKLPEPAEWRHAVEEGQVSGCDLRKHQTGDQGGQVAKASSSNRVRKSRKKPEA